MTKAPGGLERWDLDPVLPPEPHLHPARFQSVGAWRDALEREGYSMPLAMAHGLSTVMEREGMSVAEALALLYWRGGISRTGRLFVYDLGAMDSAK